MRLNLICFFAFGVSQVSGGAPATQHVVSTPGEIHNLAGRDFLTGDWNGFRTTLSEGHGVDISLAYTGEVFANTTGGLKTGAVYNGLLEVGLDLDLKKLFGWSGAKFHLLAMAPHGESATINLTGDIGTLSNIDSYDSYRLFEVWMEQNLWDERISLRIGQLAFDEEFGASDYAGLFINGGMGPSLAITANMPVSVYSITALAARLRIEPIKGFYLMGAVYDGNPAVAVLGDPSRNPAASTEFNHYGTHWALRKDEGAFVAGEIGYAFHQPQENEPGNDKQPVPSRGLAGSYKAGMGYHTDEFTDIYDATLHTLGSSLAPAELRDSGRNITLYAVADQELWRNAEATSGIGVFARLAWSPEGHSSIDIATEGGVVFSGLIPGRHEDHLGLGCAFYKISDRVTDAVRDTNLADGTQFAEPDHELVIELTYSCQITPWWTIQPDVQWIIHPGGSGEHGNALVLGVRSSINF